MTTKHIPQQQTVEQPQVSPVKNINKKKAKSPGQVKCDVCGNTFLNKYNLKRHVDNSCNPTPEQLLKGLKPGPALSILTALVKSGCLGGITNNTQNNNGILNTNTNNGTINNNDNRVLNQVNNLNNPVININPLGQENLDHISEDRRIAILKKGINAVGALYEAILEDPANQNLVVIDKRNKKVLYKNRDGKMTIGDLKKVVNTAATENIDRIDDFLVKYHDKLSRKDKTILRLIQAQGFTFPGEEADDSQDEADEAMFEEYHTRCEELIIDLLELNKGRISKRLKKYMTSLEAIEN
jgi:uncharacterized protein YeeX (DUF496 family)